jgi:hypothetical protein
MKLLIAGLFAFTGAAFAASIAPVSYHDGTLVSLSAPASASNCAEPGCDDYQTQYMVKSEGVMYALTPANTGTFVERASFGWNKAIGKTSSLYHLQPGTSLQLRDDGRHIFVKVGNHESMYTELENR